MNTYIGARYVPIFGRKDETSIQWDNTKPYEPLTIVLYQGNSYTSRQAVPIGIDITNEEFWALTGNYNAQVEQYRTEVAAYDGRITANADAIAAETQARELADDALHDVIDDEVDGLEQSIQTLGGDLSTETLNRENADTQLSDSIDSETQARNTQYLMLDGKIDDTATNINDRIDTEVQDLNDRITLNMLDAIYTNFSFIYIDALYGSDETGDGTSAAPYQHLQYVIEKFVGEGNRDLRLRLKTGDYLVQGRAFTGLSIHCTALEPNVSIRFDTGQNGSVSEATFSFYNCHINFVGYSDAYPMELSCVQSLGNIVFETSNVIFNRITLNNPLWLRQCKNSLTDVTMPNLNAAGTDITIRNTVTFTASSGEVTPLFLQDGSTWNDDGNAQAIFPTLHANSSVSAVTVRGSRLHLVHQIPYMTSTPTYKWLNTIDLNVGSVLTCPNANIYHYMDNTTIQMSTNGVNIRNGSNVFIGNNVFPNA